MGLGNTLTPTDIIVHRDRKTLEVASTMAAASELLFRVLRVYSPSAEVRVPEQETLKNRQTRRRHRGPAPVHKSRHQAHLLGQPTTAALYSWDYLFDRSQPGRTGRNNYPEALERAERHPRPVRSRPAAQGGCGHHHWSRS